MPKFLWKGISPEGQERPETVEAATAREARHLLEGRGWSNLSLLQDEIHFYSVEQVKNASDPELDVDESPEILAERNAGKNGFPWELWRYYRRSPLWNLAMLGLLIYGIYNRQPITITLSAIALLFAPVLMLIFSLPLNYYNQIQKAKVWGRWDDVQLYLDKLRKSSTWSKISVGPVEFARTQAQVLAKQGQLAEAMHVFEQVKNDPSLPEWLYHSHLAGIYDVAKEYERSLEARLHAASLAPENAALWIDVAYGCVRWLNRPAQAREALRQLQHCEINDFARNYIPFVTGVTEWRENKLLEAKQSFEQAEQNFLSVINTSPLIEGLVLLSKSYLCAIHRSLNETIPADKYWRHVEKFLRVNENESELLAACKPLNSTAQIV